MLAAQSPQRRRPTGRLIRVLILAVALAVALAVLPPARRVLGLTWLYFANDWTSVAWDSDAPRASVPFRHDGHILLPVRLNGGRTLTFALDTGAPFPGLIGGPHLDGIQLDLGRSVAIGGSGSGRERRGRVVRHLDLGLGPVELSNQTAVFIPWAEMDMFFGAEEEVYIHGILGYGLLRRFVVEIDFEREMLTLHRPDDYQYEGDGEIVPLSFSGRKPYAPAEVMLTDGTVLPVKLHVDIGQTSTLSLIPGSRPSIVVPAGAVPVEGFGLSGRVQKKMARVRELRFGRHVLRDVLCTFPSRGHATGGGRQGVVGLAALSRFRVILDYPRDRMILERTGRTDGPFEADMSGATFLPHGEVFVLKRLRSGSPADQAGLQVGDLLVGLDDVPAGELRLRDLHQRLQSGDGDRVRLNVRRNSETLSLDVTLRRRI